MSHKILHKTSIMVKKVAERDDDQGINTERVITATVESMREQAMERKKIFPLSKFVKLAQERRGTLHLPTDMNPTRF